MKSKGEMGEVAHETVNEVDVPLKKNHAVKNALPKRSLKKEDMEIEDQETIESDVKNKVKTVLSSELKKKLYQEDLHDKDEEEDQEDIQQDENKERNIVRRLPFPLRSESFFPDFIRDIFSKKAAQGNDGDGTHRLLIVQMSPESSYPSPFDEGPVQPPPLPCPLAKALFGARRKERAQFREKSRKGIFSPNYIEHHSKPNPNLLRQVESRGFFLGATFVFSILSIIALCLTAAICITRFIRSKMQAHFVIRRGNSIVKQSPYDSQDDGVVDA